MVSKLGKKSIVFFSSCAVYCTLSMVTLQRESLLWAAPYTVSEIREVEKPEESKIRELREQEIAQLRATLGRRFPANRQAELYFRLAEIYMEAYHTDYILEGRVHDRKIAQGVQVSSIDHSRSRPHLINGIKACKEILAFKIPFSKMDRVYYFLGFNNARLGERAESMKYYEALIRYDSKSPFALEAYRELGDASFHLAQFRRAIGYYESGIKSAFALKGGQRDASENSDLSPAQNVPRMRHRLAWSYYRVKDFNRAIEEMKLAIADTQKSSEKFVSLRDEALRDMAIFMTESGKVDEALRYFQTVVGDQSFYPKILEKLGRQYERNLEPVKAVHVYESLLKTHPGADATLRAFVKLIDLDLRRGLYKDALSKLTRFNFQDFNPQEEETRAAAQNLRAMIRRTATENHEKYRKSANKAQLEIAEGFYTAYLTHFLSKDDPRQETPEVQMYLAETKRDLGKASEASALYRKVVDSRDKRYAKEAGALWTASLSEAIKKSGGSQKELSDLEREFVLASDALVRNLGEASEAREAALRAAQVLAGYPAERKESIQRISEIIRRWPKTVQAVTAARLRLQLAQGQSDELKDLIKEYRENAQLMEADQELGGRALRGLLSEGEARLRVQAIAQNEKDQDYSAAAKGYEAFARDSSQADLAEKAYSSAIFNFLKADDIEAVERVSEGWLKRYPKSTQALDSIRGAATQVLILGKFDASTRLFEKAALLGDDANSLETAARVAAAHGDTASAEKNWALFLDKFKKSPLRGSVALSLAQLYEKSGREGQAAQMYRLGMSVSPEFFSECGTRLADLYARSKNFEEAHQVFKQVGAQKGVSLSPFVGYARFRLAQQMETEARFDPLQLPEAKLKVALSQRLDFLAPLSRAYLSAVDAGGPWAIAALDRLAQWAMKFGDEVDRIQASSGASAAALANFKKSLSSISAPLRKKAVDTWSESYSKSVQAEVYSPVLPEIADHLADLKAQRPVRAQGVKPKFRLSGVAPDSSSDVLKKTREKLQHNPQDLVAWVDYGNLLWGQGKPLMARIAYDRALLIQPKSAVALNNRAVVLLSQSGSSSSYDDAMIAGEAGLLFRESIKSDEFFIASKFNLASLQNYYRLFERSRNLWEQVLVKLQSSEAYDGLAVSLQGLGQLKSAEENFAKGTSAGGAKKRFARLYHEAARAALLAERGPENCLDHLDDLDLSSLNGFEKTSVERLKEICKQWGTAKADH